MIKLVSPSGKAKYILGNVDAVCECLDSYCEIHFSGGGQIMVAGKAEDVAQRLDNPWPWQTGDPKKKGRYICVWGDQTVELYWNGRAWYSAIGTKLIGIKKWTPYPER